MAAVSFSGLNGIDFSAIVTATINAESMPLNMLKQQQDDIKAKDAALVSLSGGISTMETQADALISSSLFTKSVASSSSTGVGTATSGSDALSGEYTLHVNNLAKSQVTASTSTYAATSEVAADGGSLSFTIGGVTTTSIDITAGTTLLDLRNAINAQKSGVMASIVNTGTSKKLVISSRETGEANGFKVWKTRFATIGVLICWDQWYPEAARITALLGAQVLFYPTAIGWHPAEKDEWGRAQVEAWRTIQRSHAIANGVYVASPNRIGHEDEPGTNGITFFGHSFVADPFGRYVAESGEEEDILIWTCDPALLEIQKLRRDLYTVDRGLAWMSLKV